MQLAITILGKKSTVFISDVLTAIAHHKCNILELRLSDFAHSATVAYILLEGNWNYLAKLEMAMEQLQKRLDVKVSLIHVEEQQVVCDYIPYTLEIIAINQDGILQDILIFLDTRHIIAKEIESSCYPAAYTQTLLFSAKFVLVIPLYIQLMRFREELFDFCDSLNVDAVFEPVKR